MIIGGMTFEVRRDGKRRHLLMQGSVNGVRVYLATEAELASLVAFLAQEHAAWLAEEEAARKPDPYAVLGICPGATKTMIKAAYRRLARKWHPDKTAGDDQNMKAVNQAYEALMAAGH